MSTLVNNQLTALAGQVANSLKVIPDTSSRQQQQQQQSSTVNLVNCLDGVTAATAQNAGISGIIQNDPQVAAVEQALSVQSQPQRVAANIANSIPGAQTLDASGTISMATATDMAPCNGSGNILVFQQKPTPAPTNTSNVPVLVRFKTRCLFVEVDQDFYKCVNETFCIPASAVTSWYFG